MVGWIDGWVGIWTKGRAWVRQIDGTDVWLPGGWRSDGKLTQGDIDEQEGGSVEGWMDFLWTLRKEPTEQGSLGKAQESVETRSYAHLQGKQVSKDKAPRCRCAEVRGITRGQCGEGRTQRRGEGGLKSERRLSRSNLCGAS